MPKRTRNYKSITTAGFKLDDSLRKWCESHYPAIDPDPTFEVFKDKALAGAWIYASWSAAFRNYLRNAKQYGGVVYRSGLDDPIWSQLILEARGLGFRDPDVTVDSPSSYRAELRQFTPPIQRTLTDGARSVDLSTILKRVDH